jgi:MFS family permease
VGYWALLRDNARYRRLWAGLVVSMAGDWFRTIALYHLVMHLTGASGLALSGVVLAQTLSLFLLSPVAGVVADRVSRKAIMIGADLVRAGLALGFLLVTSEDRVWLAYVLTAALMGVAAFFNPLMLRLSEYHHASRTHGRECVNERELGSNAGRWRGPRWSRSGSVGDRRSLCDQCCGLCRVGLVY